MLGYQPGYRSKPLAGSLAAAILVACLLAWKLQPIPTSPSLLNTARGICHQFTRHTEEGRNSSVAITQWSDGAIEIDVNGHVEATTEVYDMKLQRMVGHLPALLHPDPKSILGIGFGAGVSAGTFTRYPGIRKITICEIEPIIPRNLPPLLRRAELRRGARPAHPHRLSTMRATTS